MADNDFTKVTPSMLAMDDIAALLLAEYEFLDTSMNATDTDKVAGVAAAQIAVASSTGDRTTVNNSLKLNNVAASGYTTAATTTALSDKLTSIRSNYGEEITELRDELYQLKLDLAKQGLTTNTLPHAGFIDLFKVSDPVHVNGSLATATANSAAANEITISTGDYDKFRVNEWIAIHIQDAARYHVCQITEKKADGITLKFTPSTTYAIHANQAFIYKSLGESVDGSFSFLKTAENLAGAKEMECNLTDDTFRLRRQIKVSNTGYGYTFRIPEEKRGYLNSFSIQAKAYGTPGALKAYVLHDHELENFKNPAQAIEDGILLGVSAPVSRLASAGEGILEFNFYNGVQFPLLNDLDEAGHIVRYAIIIEALSADALNYYDIVFLQSRDGEGVAGDLQLNNLTYSYVQKTDNSPDAALVTDTTINAADLYYEMITRPLVNNGFTPHREAVYTAEFRTEQPIEISQARVTLRIAREGCFCSNNTRAEAYQPGYSFPFKKEAYTVGYDMVDLAGVGLNLSSDKVIIGSHFLTATAQNASEIVLQDGIYAESVNMPVYRCGYDVVLRASMEEFNETTLLPSITGSYVAELPLVAVLPDRRKRSEKISDRLVFESDLYDGETVNRFNRFELQIHWKTGFNSIYEDDVYKADLVGRIHDLVVSLERGA